MSDQILMNPFVLTPVEKEAVRGCEANLAATATVTPLGVRTENKVFSLVCSFSWSLL